MTALTVIVNLVVALGMLVLMPLGLRMIPWRGLAVLIRLWPVPAVLASVSMWLPRGWLSAELAVPYALMTVALVLVAAVHVLSQRPLRPGTLDPGQLALATALATPSVAAIALVAERAGYELFGFSMTMLALTVPHLHYAGFAAALVAGLLFQRLGGDGAGTVAGHRLAVVAALAVPAGTGIVLTGHFAGDWVEFAGAVVLTAGMWAAAWLTWTQLRPGVHDRLVRVLLAVSAVVLAVTMVLAVTWSFGHAAGLPHLSLTWMAATHGVANALGFAACALLAWRRMLSTPPAAADLTRSVHA